ncbi:MAG: TonB-dependent receptor [Flammeovirgaceae bacterium]|nr:TonB-dependent receptor [Flammeovirgaceae bacterium]
MQRILLFVFLTLGISSGIIAQESPKRGSNLLSDTISRYLDDVVITGNRIQIPFSEYSRNITIVTKEDIDNLPVQSLAQILNYVPSVDVRQRGAMGIQGDLSIRGSTFDETLVLINGIKMSDPQTGHHLLNFPLNINNVHKVEVLKGPGARIFGQNAYAGAVNVITKVPEKRYVEINGFGGIGQSDSQDSDTTFYDYGVNIGFSMPGNTYGQYLSLSHTASNGYRYNTDYEMNNLFYQSELKGMGGKFNFQFGYTDRKFGANGFYSGNNEYEEVKTSLVSMDYEKVAGDLFIKPRIYWRGNKDNYLFHRENPQWFNNVHLTNVYGGEVNLSYDSKLGVTGVGLESRYESLDGLENEQHPDAPNSLLNDDSRYNLGLFLEHRFTFKKFSITPGIYINQHSDFGFKAFPGIDMGYQLNNLLKVYGNVGKTYRVPTFFDLYYASTTTKTFGDPNLKPSEAWMYEVGLKAFDKGILGEVNYFIQNAENTIDWVNDPANPDVKWQAVNFSNVNKWGIETSFSIDFQQRIGKGAILKKISASYVYINSDLQDSQFKSRYALSHLKHQFIFGIHHKIAKNIYNSLKFRHLFRPLFDDDSILEGNTNLDNYEVLDMRIYWEKANKMVYLEATNLTGSKYVEVGQVLMPGRWFRVGVKFRFEY